MGHRKEVIKHSCAIQSENSVSLLAKKCWNIFLSNAFYDLGRKRKFEMTLADLMDALEYNSHDIKYLKRALKSLMSTVIAWDIFRKDRSADWVATTMLASVEIVDGIITYSYSSFLQDQFCNPSLYAKIHLRTQNLFESKYAECLWELACDILDPKRGEGETRWLALEDFKRFMGLKPTAYPKFKHFSQRVIKEPLEEISRVSDFAVSIDQRSHGRKVVSLKVKVSRKDQRNGISRIGRQSLSQSQRLKSESVSNISESPSANSIPLPPELLEATAKEIVEKWPLYKPLFEDLSNLSPTALAVVQGWREKAA
jgi:plasmid replication initiation protein